jgi:hypothetical protein
MQRSYWVFDYLSSADEFYTAKLPISMRFFDDTNLF